MPSWLLTVVAAWLGICVGFVGGCWWHAVMTDRRGSGPLSGPTGTVYGRHAANHRRKDSAQGLGGARR